MLAAGALTQKGSAMTTWQEFIDSQGDGGGEQIAAGYRALRDGPAIVDRSYRALLEITGADRAEWLHNLTTNQVKTLGRGEGNYAFTPNLQGRILFDMNVLAFSESIWLDLDRRFLSLALKHFDKYVIAEDVTVTDRTAEFVRIGLVGAEAVTIAQELGVPQAKALAWLSCVDATWKDVSLTLMRHDFCGPFGVELFVPQDDAVRLWEGLVDSSRSLPAIPVGDRAVQTRRIEAGIPWPGAEISEDYLPAETMQLERAVSFQKGCYLGQEVIERMRSRGVVARQLCAFEIEGEALPPSGSQITVDGKSVGKLTSVCHSPARGCIFALGYLKTGVANPGASVSIAWDDATATGTVCELPRAEAYVP